jgi:hypothetical protein
MFKDVSHATDGMDEWFGCLEIYFVAQAINVNIDYIRCGINPHSPDVIEDHGTSDDTPGISAKIFQEGKLLWGQLEQLIAAPSLMTHKVKLQIRGL